MERLFNLLATAWAEQCGEARTAELTRLLEQHSEEGIDPNTGNTLLHHGILTGNVDLVVELAKLELEGSLDATNKDTPNFEGVTPLMAATLKGDVAAVEALIGVGASFRAGDRHGQTPLYAAAAAGCTELVSLLIGQYHGRDTLSRTKFTRISPLHAACLGGHAEVVELLLATASVDVTETTATGATPLHCAVVGGNVDVVVQVLAAGADAAAKANSSVSPAELDLVGLGFSGEYVAAVANAFEHAAKTSQQASIREVVARKMSAILKDETLYLKNCRDVMDKFVAPFTSSEKGFPLPRNLTDNFVDVSAKLEAFIELRRALLISLRNSIFGFEGAESLDQYAQIISDALIKNAAFHTALQRYAMSMYTALAPVTTTAMTKVSKFLDVSYELAFVESALRLPLDGVKVYLEIFESMRDEAITLYDLPPDCSPAYEQMLNDLGQLRADITPFVSKLQNKFTCERIESTISGSFDTIVDASRSLILEGYLTKSPGSGSGRNQRRYWFLFSDILIYAAPGKKKGYNYDFKGRVELISSALRDIPDTAVTKNAFEIISKRGNFTIYAPTPEEKRKWYTAISNTTKALQTVTINKALSVEPLDRSQPASSSSSAGDPMAATMAATLASAAAAAAATRQSRREMDRSAAQNAVDGGVQAEEPGSAPPASPSPAPASGATSPARTPSASESGGGAGESGGGAGTGASVGEASAGAHTVSPAEHQALAQAHAAALGKIAELEDAKAEAALRIAAVQAQLKEAEARGGSDASADGAEVTRAARELQQSKARVTALEDQLAVAQSEAEAAQLSLSAVEDQTARLESELAEVKTVAAERLELINKLQAEKEAAQARIVELTAERDAALDEAATEAAAAKKAKKSAKKAADAAAKAAEHAAMLAELQAAEHDLEDLAAAEAPAAAAGEAPVAPSPHTTADDLDVLRNSFESREVQARRSRVKSVADSCTEGIRRLCSSLHLSAAEIKSQLTFVVDAIKMLQSDTGLSFEADTIAFVQATKLVLMSPGNAGAANRTGQAGEALITSVTSGIASWA
ncbi:ankyrin domain-containing protein [Thecamonas trahens ATCC 50062]|uniref:Ankyrin domain-containing protein n=1 Tax=Thecamonas trahens ATCC 50062 TaxID=461836 RepID=A0A0L0DCN8_THETB|nr:ankyrin domain-containing protein [Thecamonas trahens ATCC 50062]KNC50087.1 ankyrin domain-containing protein [Thecamonas trahens ATCC 50062]|eukprot:XP_013757250.1 ankyrin domain-containing protein [Thecamonas trahens ATCC 50062]